MIYLDNAATTRVSERVAELLKNYSTEHYFNPSALYGQAVQVNRDIKLAREQIANILGARGDEIYFVSSGTEADNWAIINSRKKECSRIIISAIEHAAVYNTANELKLKGYDIVYAPVDRYGKVIEEEFSKLLDNNTAMVSIMHVSNETGAINDIARLAEITKEFNKDIIFHSDGVQAFTKVKIKLSRTLIDLYSVSGHKIKAPKGIGALYIKQGISLRPMLYGGGQEREMRSSTENTAGIVSMAFAANESFNEYSEHSKDMKNNLIFAEEFIRERISDCIINTDLSSSAPTIMSIALKEVKGEVLMHSLEKHKVIVGIGSACTSKKGIKRIPASLGLPKEYHEGMIRISIEPNTTKSDIFYAMEMIVAEYNHLARYIRS